MKKMENKEVNDITEEEKEEAIKIYCLAEDKLMSLAEEESELESKIAELKKQL